MVLCSSVFSEKSEIMVKRKNDCDAYNTVKEEMREYREHIKNDLERYELMKQWKEDSIKSELRVVK